MPRYYTEEQGKKYGRKVEQQNRLRILILFSISPKSHPNLTVDEYFIVNTK